MLVINLVVFLMGRSASEEREGWVTHTHEVLHLSQQVFSSVQDAETGQRGFLLTLDTRYLVPFLKGKNDVINKIERKNKRQFTTTSPFKRIGEANFREAQRTSRNC